MLDAPSTPAAAPTTPADTPPGTAVPDTDAPAGWDGPPPPPRGPGRRQIAGVAALGLAVGAAGRPAASAVAGAVRPRPTTTDTSTDTSTTDASTEPAAGGSALPATVDPTGPHQAGVAHPLPAPGHLVLTVWDLRPAARLDRLLAGIGELTRALAAGGHPALNGLPPRRLTVTTGLGPRVVAALGRDLPGAADLPRFAREQRISPGDRGGDLALQVAADDPVVLGLAVSALRGQLAGQATPRWSQSAFRGPQDGPAARNVLGFADGITVPRSAQQLDDSVWLPADTPRVGGGTVMVVRRLLLDTARFAALALGEQERVIGRRRATGVPLSGGSGTTDVDLRARTPDGQYVVPALAHARRASPLPLGVGMMMRRSYSIADAAGSGLLFVAFQRELRTFVATQTQLDAGDALTAFATPTAGATFLVLPGFTARAPLGSALFA